MSIDQISTQIVDAITKYSPAALETAKAVERIDAIDWLLTDIMVILFGVAIAFAGRFIWKRGNDFKNNDSYKASELCAVGGIVASVGAVISAYTICNLLSSPWIIVGLTNPGLALAHDAMKKVLGL